MILKIKIISIYFFFLAICSMRNVLFVSKNSIIYDNNIFLIIYWIGACIFAMPCIICGIIIWRGLKQKWMKITSLIIATIFEILFLIGTVVCFGLFFRYHYMWIRLLLVIIALLFNTVVIYWISTHKTIKVKESNNIFSKEISE